MREQHWPDEALSAVEAALRGRVGVDPAHAAGVALDVLTALTPHVISRADLRALAGTWRSGRFPAYHCAIDLDTVICNPGYVKFLVAAVGQGTGGDTP